jgi:hypothetical protein
MVASSSPQRSATKGERSLAQLVRCVDRFAFRHLRIKHKDLPTMPEAPEKHSWVDALEESLLLAIGLFTLITWIVMIGLLAH